MYRRLALFALVMTLTVVVFGAYVRLSDAGLGCPDWPGCYGALSPHHAADEIAQAQAGAPQGPVSMPKAWKEMTHRYLAGALGLVILGIAALAWRQRRDARVSVPLAVALVGVVIVQGLLGKWTVTLLLKPAIVTGHLLGGLTTLALLCLLALRAVGMARREAGGGLVLAVRGGLLLLVCQIALGGWTSTNYAALACTDLPTCHGAWWPQADYANAFHLVRELGMTAEGALLSLDALTAIHWMHRLGAVVAGAYLLVLGAVLMRHQALAGLGRALLGGVLLQVLLGVGNVLFSLPLPLAVAHNAGAALLLLLVVGINYRVAGRRAASSVGERHENAYA
jgi:cytochrome c oxidase assembly protein subunit 15